MARSHMTDEIGRVLGGRYRLIAPIGVGSAAKVFLADDVRLRRRVAVKLLHASLADDQEFLKRFRAEVQAAAALRHPHLLLVHDWGDDGGPFVVSEHLDGGSLRGILDRGHRLSPAQALQVGLAAARGLDHAHRNGLVHRGLKPANLLFGDDGRLRVGDFGLARALAEAASTEPSGGVVPSARYAAPEQVQGHSIDGRADVYALALVLVEAVTGQVPFAADTTIGTLMARVGKPLPVPAELGPLVEPLSRAGSPDVAERLDAAGLVTALMAIASELPAPERLPLAGPTFDEADEGGAVDDPTLIVLPSAGSGPAVAEVDAAVPVIPDEEHIGDTAGPAAATSADEVAREGGAARGPGGPAVVRADAKVVAAGSPPGAGLSPTPLFDQDAVAAAEATGTSTAAPAAGPLVLSEAVHEPGVASDLHDSPEAAHGPARPGRGARVAWSLLAVLVVVAVLAAGAVALITTRIPTHAVPSLVGVSEQSATQQLQALHLKVSVSRERRDGTVAGQVISSRPAAGTRLAEGRVVALVVSDGPTMLTLPTDVAGRTQADAEAELKALGLFLAPAGSAYSETVAAGSVIGYADKTPSDVPRGSTVTLVVSQGPQPRTVPSVDGLSADAAAQALKDVGLVPQQAQAFSDTVPQGGLIGLNPASGSQVPRGATVLVVVSKGPELVAVPSMAGIRTIDDAVAALTQAGLQVGGARGRLSGRPRAFDPPSGTMVPKGTVVDVVLG